MEEVVKELKRIFEAKKEEYTETNYKLAFAMGYLAENEKINKKEAMEILFKIMQEEI